MSALWMLIAFVFIYRAACQVFLPHVVFSFLYENQFSEAPTGTAPSSASACVWQHKFVCAQLILGMTARGMVKWEGHSWLWCNCNKKQNKTLPVVWTPPKKKKKRARFSVRHSWCLWRTDKTVTAAQSSPTWGTIWQERPRHSENDAPTITRHLGFPATLTDPANCLHHPHNLLIPESEKNIIGEVKQRVEFLLKCVFKLYIYISQSVYFYVLNMTDLD